MPFTENKVVNSTWQQVTDGTNYAMVKAVNGSLQYTIADSMPAADAPSYLLGSEILNINPPLKVWIRATYGTIQVAQTIYS